MPQASPMPQPAARRTAGLVAVDGREYPLTSARLTGRAEGGVAVTTLTQEFRNPYDEPLELSYTLPLPADGAVIGYTIHVGERTIRGEVRSRKEAAEQYRKAMFEGRTASLLEQDRNDTFTQQIGCIPGKQDVRVEIELLQPLAYVPTDGSRESHPRWEYRFPTVVGVRYQGTPGRVPDAERLDPDRAQPGRIGARFGFELLVADGPPRDLNLTSPTHETHCEEAGADCRVTSTQAASLDRDLVLSWNAGTETVGVRLVEGPGLDGDGGRYGLMSITPPSVDAPALARDLTILIDASGSMHGEPLAAAKAVASALLNGLDWCDRFELLAFASDVHRHSPGMADAADVASALVWIDRLVASGATEMNRAIVESIRPLRNESQRQVVLITDGYIGFESEVVGTVMRDLPPGCRVHTVGVGQAPNRTLTRSLARAGRGIEVAASGDASNAAQRLCLATVRPLLTEVALSGSALEAHHPKVVGDVLVGSPLKVPCELKPQGGTIEVRGRLAGSSEEWVWSTEVPAAQAGGNRKRIPFGALFGREAIADLQLRQAADPHAAERLNGAIEETGLRHRIAGPRTSLIAVAEEPTVDPNAPKRKQRLPVEIPAGLSAEGVGLAGPGWDTYGTALFRAQRMNQRIGGLAYDLDYMRVGSRDFDESSADRFRVTEIEGARVLHAEGADLIVELTVPCNDFLLPKSAVQVLAPGQTTGTVKAKVKRKGSSPRGPHDRGLTVRLALAIKRGSWNPGTWQIFWQTDSVIYSVVVEIDGEND